MGEHSFINRRSFLIAGAAMAGGLLAGCTPSAHSDDAATAGATSNAPDSWDYETDVVVVGGGGMGMAAATEARAGGASVVLLEKTGKLGGDAMLSDGVVLGSGSKSDIAKGINVTVEQVVDEGVLWFPACDPARNRWIIEQGGATLDWLEEQGVVFDNPDDLMAPVVGTYSNLPIFHQVSGGGSGYQAIADNLGASDVEIMVNTPATGLYVNDAGEVIGVKAKGSGKDISIKAGKAVVLASGGYFGNQALMASFDYRYGGFKATGLQTNTGDGLIMAMQQGALAIRTSGEILEGYGPDGMFNYIQGIAPYGLTIDPVLDAGGIVVNSEGKRFTSESDGANITVNISMELADSEAEAVYVVSSLNDAVQAIIDIPATAVAKASGAQTGDGASSVGESKGKFTVYRADSIEELAELMGVDASGLHSEIEHYNEMVNEGADSDFGRDQSELHEIGGIYTGIAIWVTQTFSSGGLKINDNCEVLRIAPVSDVGTAYESIPRLYAGGDMVPYDCHGGYGVSKTFSCGRVAGSLAASLEPWG